MAIEQETAKTNPLLEEFSKLLDDDFKDRKLVENKIIKAKVIEILKSFVVVDARAKSEAMIPISEFSQEELSKLKVGTTINCFLERIENMKTGEIVLSYDKAKRMDAWNKVVKAYDNKEEIDGMITSKIKGGFIFQAFSGALPCFLPSSQLDTRPLKKIDHLMNTPLKVLPVRLDRNRGNCSVSRRAILEKNKNAETAEDLKTIKEGDIVEAQVRATTSWGVFLAYKSLDMLLHVSDLDHGRVKQPSDLVTIGQNLKVKITKIDPETNRISASIKALSSDPFEDIEKVFKIGEIYEGEIVKIMDYGAFCRLKSSVEGLIHTSEIDYTNRNINPNKVFSVGQKIKVKIVNIEKETKRISLSYKATLENPWDKVSKKIGEKVKFKINNITEKALFGELTELKLNSMCHYKELSFMENVNELQKFKKGQVIEVKIIEVKDEKIRVSKRALEKDPWDYFKDTKKKVGDVITTKVYETLKSGVKVSIDPEKKIIATIRRSDLAKEASDSRPEIFSPGNSLDAKILELDQKLRKIKLSPKAAQEDEEASLMKKFGKNASKSGAKLASIFQKAMGKNKTEKK